MTGLREYDSAEHVLQYLSRADRITHRSAGEAVVCELVPRDARRILDLGAGDGRLLALLRLDRPESRGVATDASPTMLDAARARFAGDAMVEVVEHDLDAPLSALASLGATGGGGAFDAVVSCFAIHHCAHARKRALYAEVFALLEPGGVFYNLEHVSSLRDASRDRLDLAQLLERVEPHVRVAADRERDAGRSKQLAQALIDGQQGALGEIAKRHPGLVGDDEQSKSGAMQLRRGS